MKLHPLLAAALFAGAALTAHATLIPVTGGDPGEGYAPLASTFAAVDSGGAGGFTVQGVNFTASNPNIALSATFPVSIPGYIPFASTTANDAALLAISRSKVVNTSPFTLTISGLALGTLYQVDSFIGDSTQTDVEQVSALGLTAANDLVPLSGAGVLYDVRETLQPDATGKIVLTYAVLGGQVAPFLNGISVTSAAPPTVPEPGTALAGALVLGLCGALRRRRAA